VTEESKKAKVKIALPHRLDAILFEYGLAKDNDVELVVDLPHRAADLLAHRVVDCALVPSVMYFQGDYMIVPDVAVSTYVQMGSELLVSKKPLPEVRSVAFPNQPDTSRTMLEIALRELFPEIPYRFEIGVGNPHTDLERCDGAVISGEGAFGLPEGLHKYDVGEFWVRITELPAVFSLFLVSADMPLERRNEIYARVIKAKQTGLAQSDKVVRMAQERVTLNRYRLIEYLTVNLDYDLFSRQVKSLKLLGEYMADYKLIPDDRRKELEFATHRSHVSLFEEVFGVGTAEDASLDELFSDE
jgi:predicted solute-binding protein